MNVVDKTIHERKVVARFDEADIIAALVKMTASEAGIDVGPSTRVDCVIARRDRPGTSGTEPYAVVTLTNDVEVGDGR